MNSVKRAMEARGLRVFMAGLRALIEHTETNKNELAETLRKTLSVNGDINFNSSKDIASILYEQLGVRLKSTATGRFSASKQSLKAINNPITDKITLYRITERLLSCLNSIYAITNHKLHRLFCSYDDACPSGRLYTKNYNVQGIPEVARSTIKAEKGCSFVLADYDTFELKVLSALSCDEYFKNCWAKGLDLHRKVVSDMLGAPYDEVTDQQRKIGKVLNFGQSYGQEPSGLARNLHVSTEKARELMAAYKSKIPAIEKFKVDSIEKARQTGYAETYHGRRRFLPDILSPNTGDRKKAERRVVNHAIQGTAADIVKYALVKLHNMGFVINTMLHDAVLISVPKDDVPKATSQIREAMETEINGLKFTVTIKTGETWGECK